MTGVRWQEHFDGWLGRGSIRDADFNEALLSDQRHPATMSIDVYYDDVDRWIRDPSYAGRVDGGRLVCDGIAVANATVESGKFRILEPAGGELSDALHLRMRYTLALRQQDTGDPLTLHGFKLIENDPGFDAWRDSTTLFTRIYAGTDVPEDADPDLIKAFGVLRISLGSFARQLLSFSGTGNGLTQRAGAVLRYQAWFGRRMARAYVGKPITQTRPSFPIDHPEPNWETPPPLREWHPVATNARLERKVVPFEVDDLDFPLNVQRLRLAGAGEPEGEPVLLIPGSGVRANMFYGQPVGVTLAEYLLKLGYDVWAENWRASIDFPPNSYTLDSAARFDHPRAVDVVLEQTGRAQLRTVVHCQGSVGFLMAYAAGYLDGKISHCLSSAVSLFVEVKLATWLKQQVAVPVVQAAVPWMDAQWGLRSDNPAGSVFGAVARRTERPCGNPACQLANFMYGSGWDTLLLHKDPEGRDWIDPTVHEWSARELGATPMSFIDQISDASRYGHIVPAQPRDPAWPANYLARPRRLQPEAERARFTFMAGDNNRMFRWQGQKKAAKFMREMHACPSVFVGLPGFGHLDTIWGIHAPERVYPVIADGLAWSGDGDAPPELAQGRGEDRALSESWPQREGRLAAVAGRARRGARVG